MKREARTDGTTTTDIEEETVTGHGVEESMVWVVGSCSNNYSVKDVIDGTTTAKKYLILKLSELYEATWPYLHRSVHRKRFILLQWPMVVGPGSEASALNSMYMPIDLSGIQGIVLSYLEGTTMQDNEDDRYWYYHYEQMGVVLDADAMRTVPVKLVAFNGLYLTRSTAPDMANCTHANGFYHYLNDKDTVRLNARAYKRRIEAYSMINRYNIWAISEFISPDFNMGNRGMASPFNSIMGVVLVIIPILIEGYWTW